MTSVVASFAHWLADYYLLSSVLLAFTLAALALTRQPAQRRAITQSSLIALILLAALCALPGWSMVSLLSVSQADSSEESVTSIEVEELHPGDESATRSVDSVGLKEPFTIDQNEFVGKRPAPVGDVAQNALSLRDVPWAQLASVVWALGAACVIVWLALGLIAAARLRRRSQSAPSELLALMSNVAGGTQQTKLLTSTEINVAVALGIWRPVVMLPHIWVNSPNGSSTRDLHTVLAHELAHIHNNDLRWLAVSRALTIILWSQPLYWLVRRRMRLDQEALADAAAAELTSRQRYAEQLVAWAREMSGRPTVRLSSAVGLWESPSQLRRRIALLLDERFTLLRQCPRRWQFAALAVSLFAALSLSLITLQPALEARAEPAAIEKYPASNATTEPDAEADYENALKEFAKPIPNTIQGRLVDERRQPIAGADVFLFRVNQRDASRRKLGQTTTDADGRYRFDRVIDIEKEFPDGKIPSLDYMTEEFVQVAARAPNRISDAWLDMPQRVARHGLSQQFQLPVAATLRGRVTGPEGKPVADALVSCSSMMLDRWDGAKSDRTDADGKFEINDVAAFDIAEYRKQQEEQRRKMEEQSRQGGNNFTFFAAPPVLTVEHPNFAVKKTSYDSIPGNSDVQLALPAAIEGRVLDGETGKPAVGALVTVATSRTSNLVPTTDAVYYHHRATVRTDADGKYRFSTLPPGTYDVWAESTGRVNEGETGIAATADKAATAPDLTLIVGAPVTIGLVEAKSGKPLGIQAGTQAIVGAHPIRLHTIGRPDGTQAAVANSDGKFEVRTLSGKYRVWVGSVDVDGETKWLGQEPVEVEVVEGQTVSVAVPVADVDEAQITGTVSAVGMAAPKPSRKQHEAVLKAMTAALAENPNEPDTLLARAQALQALGEYRKAVEDYERLIELNPPPLMNAIARNNLAYVLSTAPDDSIRNGNRAVALTSEAQKFQPNLPDVFDTLAAALAEKGDFGAAIDAQTKALELRPENNEFKEHLKLYQAKKPLRDQPPASDTDTPANDEGALLKTEPTEQEHADDEHTHITFIVAKQALIHDGKPIEWADVERLITAQPDPKLVHPVFKFTIAGAEKHQEDIRAKIWDLRKRVPLHGHTWSSVAPEDYERYDLIQKPAAPQPNATGARPDHKIDLGTQRVLVLDESDKPIAGVTIRPEQFQTTEEAGIEWIKQTNAEGRAAVPYPRTMVERYGIQSMTFTFEHPEFVPKYNTVRFSAREAVVKLARGGRVEITGVADDGWNIGTLYALCDKLNPRVPWLRPGGADSRDLQNPVASGPTIRSPQLPTGKTRVRAVAFRPDGSTLFSNPRPVEITTGDVQKFEVELRPGFKLDGSLSANVPRPVRNGRVLLSISSEFGGGWSDWTTVHEDGSFTFDSLPPDSGSKAQLVAVCDGFVSASPKSEKFSEGGMMVPQTFALARDSEKATLEMQPAGRCTVKVRDPAGNALAGVRVQATPNYAIAPNGSTSFGPLGSTRQMLLEGTEYQAKTDLKAFPYEGTSGDDGIVELSNLPPFVTYVTAASDDYELPRDPTYFPLAMPITRMQVKSGDTTRVNLTLVPIKTTR